MRAYKRNTNIQTLYAHIHKIDTYVVYCIMRVYRPIMHNRKKGDVEERGREGEREGTDYHRALYRILLAY